LPRAALIGLRAVDADGISVEGNVAKLPLAGVIIAHDTGVEYYTDLVLQFSVTGE
jgi:hypothetical protein